MKYLLYILFVGIVLFGCKNSSNSGNSEDEENYPDGTYCSDVTYYNPNTGTENTYRLNVDVENNELVKIHWNNGGWLDESHFTPKQLDNSGYCSFTSDKGYEYKVQIRGSRCNGTDEIEFGTDKKASTCPKCGGDKETYYKYCNSCLEDIEEHTCKKCGNYDSFMFSTDDECSDCKRKRKQQEEEEEEKKKSEEDNN